MERIKLLSASFGKRLTLYVVGATALLYLYARFPIGTIKAIYEGF